MAMPVLWLTFESGFMLYLVCKQHPTPRRCKLKHISCCTKYNTAN